MEKESKQRFRLTKLERAWVLKGYRGHYCGRGGEVGGTLTIPVGRGFGRRRPRGGGEAAGVVREVGELGIEGGGNDDRREDES